MNQLNTIWKLIFGTLVAAALIVAYLLKLAPEASDDWEAFKDRNHCVSVAEHVGNNQAGWRCDDGQIHYRWRQQK